MLKNALITFGFMALFAAIEFAFGLYRRPGVLTMRELGGSLVSLGNSLLIRGAFFGALTWALGALLPSAEGALAGVSFWLVFPLYLLFDEYVTYWVHRKSHEVPWLWRIHKPHHAPRNMNAAVTFRNNWLWLFMMPYAWLPAFAVWLGQPTVYMATVTFKTLLALLVHCELRWDLHLQHNRFLRPVMWVLERVISLPDTHHVHHGVGRYGNAMKNYGATLIVFDVLHGTVEIPHARQEGFGLPEGAPVEPWAEQIFWPLLRSNKEIAALRPPFDQASPDAAVAAARAVIRTADGRAVVVS